MWWSWILAISGTGAMFVIGRKKRWGWLWFIFNECLWVTYSLITKQYGFILGAMAYGTVAIKSFLHWSRDEKELEKVVK
jgi:hypothetical protein